MGVMSAEQASVALWSISPRNNSDKVSFMAPCSTAAALIVMGSLLNLILQDHSCATRAMIESPAHMRVGGYPSYADI